MRNEEAGTVSLAISEHERAALAELAQFPLFAALTGRRSRRFPVGGRIPAGALAFTSRQPVQPLSDVERALLVSTTGGVTGWNFGITANPSLCAGLPNYSGSATGRTFPSAATASYTSQLFFTDDTGTYLLPSRDEHPREIRQHRRVDQSHRRVLCAYLSRTPASNCRAGNRTWEGHNIWIGNHPGSLLAFPVADLAEHLMENAVVLRGQRLPDLR